MAWKRLCTPAKVVGAAMILMLTVPASPLHALSPRTYDQRLEEHVAFYHHLLERVPSVLKCLLAGHRVNGHIETGSGAVIIGIATSRQARITDIVAGGISRPTINVYIPARMVDELLDDPSPEKMLAGIASLKIEGVGLVNRIKAGMVAAALTRIAGLIAVRGVDPWAEASQAF